MADSKADVDAKAPASSANSRTTASPDQPLPQDDIPPTYDIATGTVNTNHDGYNTGLNTESEMADDGRVDITIDDSSTHLAQQLEQLRFQDDAESIAAPSYTATTLLNKSFEAPPPLNVVIQVVGSRGDVQPFVALGQVLKNRYGHRVRLATHGTFKKFVEENGLEFFSIGGDPAELMAFMVKNPGLIPNMKSLKAGDVGKRRKGMKEILEGCWKSCADADEVQGEEGEEDQPSEAPMKTKPFIANAIIANPPSFAHIHIAERLGIPLHLMFTMPWSPTQSFPQPIANIKSTNAKENITNEMSYTLVDMLTWQGLGDIINAWRKDTLGLMQLHQAAAVSALNRLRIPFTYCWSPALIPKPKDWRGHITISGFYFLSLASNYQPDSDLAEFLASGPPPVYIGFGSIVVEDPNAMTKLIFDAVKKTGQRALVSKGWGGFGGDEMGKPEGVFMLGNCPHDWLFQHVSCVVHHGGAGTTAAGIALGRPTVIVPFFGDQPFWGAMVARAGAGPDPIPHKQLTADNLAAAILHCLKPETIERAKELGDRIREEKGCEVGAASFHAQMDMDRMRCMFAPERVAVWQVKTKSGTEDIRLSAFAATVLGNQGILDVNRLESYRPYEYQVAEHAVAANLSGPNPILSSVGTLTQHVINFPINVGKAYAGVVYEPYKGARKGGWEGLGKGLKKGFGNLLFARKGFVIGGTAYGLRAAYNAIRKHYGNSTLSYILAAHYSQGFEDVQKSTEQERNDVIVAWHSMSPVLKKSKSATSSASSTTDLRTLSSKTSTASSQDLGRTGTTKTTSTARSTSNHSEPSQSPERGAS